MKFFLPGSKPSAVESDYAVIVDTLKKQLRWSIIPRRIYSLNYLRDKKRFKLQVGEEGGQGGNFTVVAILESSSYIVFTRANDGEPGVIMLVNHDDVTAIEDFENQPAPQAA